MKEIYLAGGCFWGTEHFMKLIPGVIDTETGYANSSVPNPTYREVCSGRTGAAETVKVTYNPEKVTLPFLLNLYFRTIDPTLLNRQGNDRGTQYRTGIFYTDASEKPIIEKELHEMAFHYAQPIKVEVAKLDNFYPAEEYHQDYLENNPGGYCHINPSLFRMAANARDPEAPANRKNNQNTAATVLATNDARFRRKTDDELKASLTPLQYEVTQHSATERPFTNQYDNEFRKGIYVDITTGQPLFLSSDKYNSVCGWPAFSRPIDPALIENIEDHSHGMHRIEVRSKLGDAHLGHVFNDGPSDKGGLRYCINSASLRFIPEADMAAEGYADYLPLLDR